MRSATIVAVGLGVSLAALPAAAQFYGHDVNSYSHSRESGIDPLSQYSFDGMRLNSTVEFLQRKAEADRKRRELQESQRRRSENEMTNTPERLMDSYFNRRSSNKK